MPEELVSCSDCGRSGINALTIPLFDKLNEEGKFLERIITKFHVLHD